MRHPIPQTDRKRSQHVGAATLDSQDSSAFDGNNDLSGNAYELSYESKEGCLG